MSTCCDIILTTFTNQTLSIIPYSGDRPTVSVAYLIDGIWQAMGVATNIKFKNTITGTKVVVDHGGIASGVIKLVQ